MIEQFVDQESCLKCHGCCRFSEEDSVWLPRLLNEEIEEFARHGLPNALITSDKKIRVASFPKENIFICSLFNPEGNKCKIYDYRPFECQIYPFLLNRKDDKVFLALDQNCPYAQENLKAPRFQAYVKYLSGLLKSPQYQELLKNNPRIIQEYAGVLELSEI